MAEPETYSGNGHTARIADPENITRDECMKLAACGSAEWNKWRKSYPVRGVWGKPYENKADFSGRDFTADFVDFGGFHFGHGADFRDAEFSLVFFTDSTFGRDAKFTGAQFEGAATFDAAKFGPDACFNLCRFGPSTSFDACEFDDRATFIGATFGEEVNLRGAIFGNETSFDWTKFGQQSSFVGSLFIGDASFVAATIGFEADFSGLLVGGELNFEAAVFEGQTSFAGFSWGALNQQVRSNARLQRLAKDRQASPWVFKAINFQGAHFEGRVEFSDRHFEGATEFSKTQIETILPPTLDSDTPPSRVYGELMSPESGAKLLPKGRCVIFSVAPEFFQCRFHQNFSFEGAKFPVAQGTESAARAYRVLKQVSSAQQAIREEHRFFKLEMQEEAAAENSWKRWLYQAYEFTSDFGFSVRRPALLLLVALLLMLPMYAWQAGLQVCWPGSAHCNMTGPLIQFASAHAIPGFEKLAEPASKSLFGDQLGVWTVLTVLLHKAISVLALFLVGLALRNLFKMK